jgi:hypothetical protein
MYTRGIVTTAALVSAALFGLASAQAANLPAVPYGPGRRTTYTVQAQPALGTCHYRYTAAHQPLPDRHCDPGALNPKVRQSTIRSTICHPGYTALIRPPASITSREKAADARSYGYRGSLTQTEYDHLVPLELGGDPNDRRNLWVEPPSPGHRLSQRFHNPKDAIENKAHYLVCSGIVPLVTMQRAIAFNWTTALAVVGHPNGR